MNVYHWPRKHQQCDTKQADCRRRCELSERLKPAGILELGNKLSGKPRKDDRYGEDSRCSCYCTRHGGDVIADECREYQNRAGRCIRKTYAGSKLRRSEPSRIRYR